MTPVALAIRAICIGWFSLLWLPSLLGIAGPSAWAPGFYLQTVALCQIPATIAGGLVYLVT